MQKGIIGLKATNEDSKKKVFLNQLTCKILNVLLVPLQEKYYILYKINTLYKENFMKIFIVLVLGTSLFGQAKEVNSSAMWGVYSGYQSMQISGIEDDASDEELSSFSSDRLGSYYIGVWKSTDWKIGSLPVTIGAELGHRGTSSNYETDSSQDQPLMYINSAEILITYLDLWTTVNYRMSDKFNLWIGPSIGIHLDEKVTLDIEGQEAESAELSTDFGFDENDFGFLVGAGYSISGNIHINAGLYKGLKDHDGGKFNNLFIDLGYSF